MATPEYLVNTETREIFAYEATLAKMPKFAPFHGKLPPPDFQRGVPLAPAQVAVEAAPRTELTPDERIDVIAGVIHLVPKEEISEAGQPSLVAVEKLSQLSGVTRKEVNAAVKKRVERLNAPAVAAAKRDKELLEAQAESQAAAG